MKDLKSRILKFAHSKRGLYDKGYTEDNWYFLKAEALKFAHKMEYNSAINNLAKWFKEHNEDKLLIFSHKDFELFEEYIQQKNQNFYYIQIEE